MGRLVAALAGIGALAPAACFGPRVPEGLSCAADGICPLGQRCVTEVCRDADNDPGDSGPADAAAWDGCVPGETCEWQIRQFATIDGSAFAEELTDVPILFRLDDAVTAAGSPEDLRVFSGATPLAFEIEEWVSSGAVVWVKVPRLEASESGAQVTLYYGNVAASAVPPNPATWSNGYVGVWHLASGGDQVSDSSSAGNDCVRTGLVAPSLGIAGDAVQFDGTSFLDCGASSSLDLGQEGTISAWVNFSAFTMFAAPIGKTQFGGIGQYSYGFQRDGEATGGMEVAISSSANEISAVSSPGALELGRWIHLVGAWDGDTVRIFVDGALSGSVGQSIDPRSSALDRLTIGCAFSPNCDSESGVIGLVDEARVASVARSAEWVKAQYLAVTGSLVSLSAPDVR